MESNWVWAGVLATPIAVYVLARVAGIAWFRSKRTYINDLIDKVEKEDKDGAG